MPTKSIVPLAVSAPESLHSAEDDASQNALTAFKIAPAQTFATAIRQKEALYRLTDRLQRASSFEEIYAAGLDAILDALRCERAAILLCHKEIAFMAAPSGLEGWAARAGGVKWCH